MVAAPRHVLALGLLGLVSALLLIAPPALGGQSAQPMYQPRADHIGVVVTADEVLMSWHRLEGADAGTAIVRRGGGGACPHTPAEGLPAGEVTHLHVIDRTVQAGSAYCYTLFSKATSGAVRTIGSSGRVTVPDVSVVPPATAPAPAPVPVITVSNTPSLARTLAFTGAGALAILLVAVALVGRTRRVAGGRAIVRPTARGLSRMERRSTRDHPNADRGAAGAPATPRPPTAARAELMDAITDSRPRRDPALRVRPTAVSTKPDQTILVYASAYAAACRRGDPAPMAAVAAMVPPTTPDPDGYASQAIAEARHRGLLTDGKSGTEETTLSARALQLLHGSAGPPRDSPRSASDSPSRNGTVDPTRGAR